jgi:hypothetical protein
MTYDGIFLITSALRTIDQLSKYSSEERFNQTIETIQSIKKYGPSNSKLYLIEGSSEDPDADKLKIIEDMDVHIFKAYENPETRLYAQRGFKTFIENLCLFHFLDWFSKNPVEARRIYKISGRYVLNNNFKPGFDHKDAFVFLRSFDSWMSPQKQEETNAKKFYETRLYHMDYSLLNTYRNEVVNMINDSIRFDINVEHAMYKFLSKYNVVEVDKIGVSGFISPSGEFKDD